MKRSSALVAALAVCGALTLSARAEEVTAKPGWAGAWGYATSPAVQKPVPTRPAGTFRYRLRLTQGGDRVTIRITNPEDAIPLALAAIRVARASGSGGATAAGERTLLFAGAAGITLQAGQSATSDAVPLRLRAGDTLSVTLTTSAPSTLVMGNAGFVSTFTPDGGEVTDSQSRPVVSLVSVYNPTTSCTIVALGDSITEGALNRDPVHRGWPDRLADRLTARSPAHHCGVVNSGISGNRVLVAGRGMAAVDRFDRDVAAVPGVTHVLLLEGINDITRSFYETPITAANLIAGYRRIIAMAHARHIKIIGGTLTPGWGYRLTSPKWEALRDDVNGWIRTSGEFDAVIDFEKALKDNSAIPTLVPAYDSGDHLHPSDAGYQAMADAVPLEIFDPLFLETP